ncbi:uncharacterized protein BDR25DRAFT_348315 [Lindgomyces ingoldianus]|uniref:Uncharacterized protein n=1 Tax=Lindgomyces ingoldianus TaxID=673940 RepID=A0ACB6RFI8_9PLEO|nr:uncharacterized protein BDR25DRAFT_348315 [Lindgomyces ingoldianus]KAF2478029.1 hypothetical protein BDR25DRAFT_348315 [Lindgomyces ingoldianus]
METSKKKLGADHPSTLSSMANLASTYWNQGRWDAAEKLEVEVMETRKKKLGADHPDTLTSMANLASTAGGGTDHPDTLTSIGNLAYTMKRQGRNAEAISLIRECAQLQQRVLGPTAVPQLEAEHLQDYAKYLHERGSGFCKRLEQIKSFSLTLCPSRCHYEGKVSGTFNKLNTHQTSLSLSLVDPVLGKDFSVSTTCLLPTFSQRLYPWAGPLLWESARTCGCAQADEKIHMLHPIEDKRHHPASHYDVAGSSTKVRSPYRDMAFKKPGLCPSFTNRLNYLLFEHHCIEHVHSGFQGSIYQESATKLPKPSPNHDLKIYPTRFKPSGWSSLSPNSHPTIPSHCLIFLPNPYTAIQHPNRKFLSHHPPSSGFGNATSANEPTPLTSRGAVLNTGTSSALATRLSRTGGNEFDYQGWKAWGQWRRSGRKSSIHDYSSGSSDNSENETSGNRESGMSKGCWNMRDYPSECRWGRQFGIYTLLLPGFHIIGSVDSATPREYRAGEEQKNPDFWRTLIMSAKRMKSVPPSSPLSNVSEKAEPNEFNSTKGKYGDTFMSAIDPVIVSTRRPPGYHEEAAKGAKEAEFQTLRPPGAAAIGDSNFGLEGSEGETITKCFGPLERVKSSDSSFHYHIKRVELQFYLLYSCYDIMFLESYASFEPRLRPYIHHFTFYNNIIWVTPHYTVQPYNASKPSLSFLQYLLVPKYLIISQNNSQLICLRNFLKPSLNSNYSQNPFLSNWNLEFGDVRFLLRDNGAWAFWALATGMGMQEKTVSLFYE